MRGGGDQEPGGGSIVLARNQTIAGGGNYQGDRPLIYTRKQIARCERVDCICCVSLILFFIDCTLMFFAGQKSYLLLQIPPPTGEKKKRMSSILGLPDHNLNSKAILEDVKNVYGSIK